MTGAIFQLHCKGIQDKLLTSSPELSFFKSNYKRYVNFASEMIYLNFNEYVNFNQKVSIIIPKKGDFLGKMYLNFTLPKLVKTSGTYAGWTNSLGYSIIKYVDIEIGNNQIVRHTGLFLEIWNELTVPISTRSSGEDMLIGKYDSPEFLKYNAETETVYSVPLKFWFNRISSSFPLINLQFQEVKLTFHLRPFEECIVYDGDTPPNPVEFLSSNLITEYIFLEDDERLKYKTMKHAFLIEQLQIRDAESIPASTNGIYKLSLNFNNPCKELIWVFVEDESEENNDWFHFGQRNTEVFSKILPLMKKAKLILDGKDRTQFQDEYIYRINNTQNYHTNTVMKHIYTMPFCEKPEDWQPSGTLNFSAIDDSVLYVEMKENIRNSKIYVFAISYNWLFVEKGIAYLAFNS